MKNIKTRYYLEPKEKSVEERIKPELIMAEISGKNGQIDHLFPV